MKKNELYRKDDSVVRIISVQENQLLIIDCLIYILNDGTVLYGNGQAREVVKQFRKLCYGKSIPVMELFGRFFERTKNATKMEFYSDLLNKAIRSIKGEEESKAVQMMFDFGGFNNAFAGETADDFELISFLVVE